MYLSEASLTTQAKDTFFRFARFSRVSYSSDGKLIDARIGAFLLAIGPLLCDRFSFITGILYLSPLYTILVKA
jgi:hypothetical protein